MRRWLVDEGIMLDVHAADLSEAIAVAIPVLTALTGLEPALLVRCLEESTRESNVAIGAGIAVPHASIEGLAQPVVAFVRLADPIAVGAIDRVPADLIFITLFPAGDPAGHLVFLAHLAHLAHSRVFRDGLRGAANPPDVVALVEAAEARKSASPHAAIAAPTAGTYLAMISLAGEKAVDAVLVELLNGGFGDATIVDAQSVSEAASREVPLFARFQDIFGDPGGRRLILALVPGDQVEQISSMVRRVCDERRAVSGEVLFVPVVSRWKWSRLDPAPPTRGH